MEFTERLSGIRLRVKTGESRGEISRVFPPCFILFLLFFIFLFLLFFFPIDGAIENTNVCHVT